jgi:hypothetical protein
MLMYIGGDALTRRKYDFSEDTKIKSLLWSYRHCCLCEKPCGTNIEVAHIEKGKNDLDNAIPLCYDCHSEIDKYNIENPIGNKFRPQELKTRRDQIYEKYTRHLVPPVHFEVTQIIRDNPNFQRELINVGFNLHHLGNSNPIRARVEARIFLGNKSLGFVGSNYYNGKITWCLNPLSKVFGNFNVPQECKESDERLTIEVVITIIDIYDREHRLLPNCFTYIRKDNGWFSEPTSFEGLSAH